MIHAKRLCRWFAVVAIAILSCQLLANQTKPQSEAVAGAAMPNYSTSGWKAIDIRLIREIDRVVHFDASTFFPARSRVDYPVPLSFLVPKAAGERLEEQSIECERSVEFVLIFRDNRAGNIKVGICERPAGKLAEFAEASKRMCDEYIAQLASKGREGDEKAIRQRFAKLGLLATKQAGPRGSTIYYVPFEGPTVVLVSKGRDQAVAVQAGVGSQGGLCEEAGPHISPLCADARKALIEIVQRIYAQKQLLSSAIDPGFLTASRDDLSTAVDQAYLLSEIARSIESMETTSSILDCPDESFA